MAVRVLQVVQPEDGGVAEHVLLLSGELARRGWEVEVAAGPAFVPRRELERRGVTVHALPLRRAPGAGDVAAARALRALAARRDYALVHAHSSKAGALVRLALPRAARLVYTPHCAAFYSAMGSRATREAYRAVEQALVPRTGAFVAVCEWERRQLAGGLVGAGARVEVVLNGVAPCSPVEPDPELVSFRGDGRLVGLVTALRVGKDVSTLLAALDLLAREDGDPPRGVVVGNGPLAPLVAAEIARRGLGDRVRLVGFERPSARWLRALDVFALPTDWEALPLSVLEAMHCGLPVVASDVGGVGEAVDDGVTGRLVPPRDPAALARALADVLHREDAGAALGRAGAALAARRFSVTAMADGVEEVYARRLGRGSS